MTPRRHIVIVDDEPNIGLSLRLILEGEGYRVSICESAGRFHYLRRPGRGIRPGRNEVESVNRPVVVGGVLVKPGDVVVADGDGVVVVPRDVALKVAEFAHKIIEADKAGRRELYKKLGLPDDPSVR